MHSTREHVLREAFWPHAKFSNPAAETRACLRMGGGKKGIVRGLFFKGVEFTELCLLARASVLPACVC